MQEAEGWLPLCLMSRKLSLLLISATLGLAAAVATTEGQYPANYVAASLIRCQ